MEVQYQPHQQRVIDERNELQGKLIRLEEFLETEIYDNLSRRERNLLSQQVGLMDRYIDILNQRISLF